MAKDTGSKGMGKYPKGHIHQHKSLATGASLPKANTADKGGDVNLKGGMGKGGRISSSGDTGGPYKPTPPKTSRSTPA
jgi:hypothetical protein